ncbi:MAG: HNH endonuclease, partial [Actinobacteria bacterium]|nr:HNH endonuclease [Actinomycetota bacterium]
RWCLTLTGPDDRVVAHACARRGQAPEPGGLAIRWAYGLRERLQFLASGTCSHARQTAAYQWPPSLRHLIEIRQRTCAAPGCRRPAGRSDIDHTVPFENGGLSCECNGAPLCRRHHRGKVVPGWQLTQDQPGVMTWRLPGDRTYTTSGDPYPV